MLAITCSSNVIYSCSCLWYPYYNYIWQQLRMYSPQQLLIQQLLPAAMLAAVFTAIYHDSDAHGNNAYENFYSCVLLTATVSAAIVLRCACKCYLGEQCYFQYQYYYSSVIIYSINIHGYNAHGCDTQVHMLMLLSSILYSSNVPYNSIYIQQQCYLLYSSMYIQPQCYFIATFTFSSHVPYGRK